MMHDYVGKDKLNDFIFAAMVKFWGRMMHMNSAVIHGCKLNAQRCSRGDINVMLHHLHEKTMFGEVKLSNNVLMKSKFQN